MIQSIDRRSKIYKNAQNYWKAQFLPANIGGVLLDEGMFNGNHLFFPSIRNIGSFSRYYIFENKSGKCAEGHIIANQRDILEDTFGTFLD